jgi:hypothetical protein
MKNREKIFQKFVIQHKKFNCVAGDEKRRYKKNIKLMLLMTKLLVTCTIAHIEKSRSIVKMRQNMSIKITILIFLVDFQFYFPALFRTRNLAELSFFSLSLFPVENYYFTKI